MDSTNQQTHKPHRERQSGVKAQRKKEKLLGKPGRLPKEEARKQNIKAFGFKSSVKARKAVRRAADLVEKKTHAPLIDRTPVEPPPVICAIVGPSKVGKSTVVKDLLKHYTRQNLDSIRGPVTIVTGKKRRLTLLECNNDINSMVDVAKVADLVLLLIDASYGFEMETFEFLNICQVHGMPKIMGVLTHLDLIKNKKVLKTKKKLLKHRFWTEVYQGAKLFYLSGMIGEHYLRNEVANLARFISVMKFRPLLWRISHPYVLCDRMEDMTDPEIKRSNPKCDRNVCLYGYVRGTHFINRSAVHIPGVGDTRIREITFLSDPCPLPEKDKKRSLNERERLIYAPLSGLGGIVYDKDAVYVDVKNSQRKERDENEEKLVGSLAHAQETIDMKMAESQLSLFSRSKPVSEADAERLFEEAEEMRESDDDDQGGYQSDSGLNDEVSEEGTGLPPEKNFGEDTPEEFAFDSDEDDTPETALTWKANLAEKAAKLFHQRKSARVNWNRLVYGDDSKIVREEDEDLEEQEEEIGGLFRLARNAQMAAKEMKHLKDQEDSCCYSPAQSNLGTNITVMDWERDEVKEAFVSRPTQLNMEI